MMTLKNSVRPIIIPASIFPPKYAAEIRIVNTNPDKIPNVNNDAAKSFARMTHLLKRIWLKYRRFKDVFQI